ncbi:hypothetical protein C8R45DRAFT_1020202 [Mycena sanguinolenta]|nr:hypothetical protein C8R45DRAFT_1020202 [Mycena sanguinolenta]
MKLPFSILVAVILSLDTFAAPVPNAQVGDNLALEARKTAAKPVAKPAAKPAPKPVPNPVAKPAPKPAAPPAKPAAKPAAPPTTKPVAPPAAKPTAKPVAKPAAPPAAKPAAPAVKPTVPAAKPAAPAAKPPVSKAPTSATTKAPTKSAAPEPTASSCPITPAAKTTTAKKATVKVKRMLEKFIRNARIANRTFFGLIKPRLTEGNEFVGWHGTNEETAALWESRGEIVRPVTKEGQTKGKSGLDAELGPGLYISDTLSVAEAAAAINAQNNKLAGKVCAIFAKSSSSFRASQDKVQIPEVIRGNAAIKGQERASYLVNLPSRNTGGPTSLLLGPLTSSTNQMLIPESQNSKFEAQCFDITGLDSADAAAFEESNGAIKYTSASLISEWKIRKEDTELAQATVAAFEKKCTA